MYKYIVYCTICTENSKIYVGVHQTENPNIFDGYIGCGVYINQPSTYKLSKTLFQRAVNKYGPSKFTRKVIAIFQEEEDAYSLEEDIVNEEFLKRTDVYNTCLGGLGGDRGINSKPCYQYDLEGNFIREFKSRQEASRYLNKGFTTIKRAIKDKIKAANCFWSEVKVEKLDLSEYKTSTNRIPVFQYSNTGEYDCCYESISDAARVLNRSASKISEASKLGILYDNKYFSFEFDFQFSVAKYNYLYEIPIYVYNIYGEFYKQFDNLKVAKKELKIKNDLFKYIRLNKPYKELYQFSFEKLDSMPDKSIKKPGKRKIAQYDLNDNLIKIWDSISDCVKVYGTGVKHCLSGRNHQSKGFKYKYIENS